MLLAIDAGNTNVVLAVYDGETRRGQWRVATDRERTADDYAVWLLSLMELNGLSRKDISGAIVGTVVPQALFDLRLLCTTYFDCEPMVVGLDLDLGIEIDMDEPATAGADRICNAVAVHKHHGGPAIVIDFGTGTTFDVVDGKGNYRGGVIAPGINLSLEALHNVSAQLPRIAVVRPARVIGGGTVSAMQSGIYWGYVSLIEGLVHRIRDEFGSPMKVIATGGLGPMFADATEVIDLVDPDLTMQGLYEIYRRNKDQGARRAAM